MSVGDIINQLIEHEDVTLYDTGKFKTSDNSDYYSMIFKDSTPRDIPGQYVLEFPSDYEVYKKQYDNTPSQLKKPLEVYLDEIQDYKERVDDYVALCSLEVEYEHIKSK